VTTLRHSVIAIFGPTASGKSDVAYQLASRLRTEVVSADALQVYEGVPILTNQSPWPARLTSIRRLSDDMSVGEYAGLAHDAIDDLDVEFDVLDDRTGRRTDRVGGGGSARATGRALRAPRGGSLLAGARRAA
jgi:adenylate kinase family enzyme